MRASVGGRKRGALRLDARQHFVAKDEELGADESKDVVCHVAHGPSGAPPAHPSRQSCRRHKQLTNSTSSLPRVRHAAREGHGSCRQRAGGRTPSQALRAAAAGLSAEPHSEPAILAPPPETYPASSGAPQPATAPLHKRYLLLSRLLRRNARSRWVRRQEEGTSKLASSWQRKEADRC